jgi:outer membrane receptor protein involved in Fe transport
VRVVSTKKAVLMASSLLAGLAMAGGAAAAEEAANSSTVGELVVTGSRIPRPNLDQPTPVAVLSQQVIQNAGPQSLGDIISQLPEAGFTGTLRANSNNFGNGAGVSSIDLRNLGLSRTLVLVDGQRHVAGDVSTNAVDVNSIPKALVDHVEVTTGGASAVYGSDAVSGVVNIILKKKFEGLEFNAQAGGYDNGFGAKYSADLTAGRTFLDGKLNVVASGFWSKEAGIDARNLPQAHNYGQITNPNDLKGPLDPTFYSSPSPIRGDHIPDALWVQNVGSDFVTLNGVLLNPNTGTPQFAFDRSGHLVPVAARTGFNSSAFAQLPANCLDCYFTEDYEQETSPFESKGANIRLNYDWTDHLHATLDAKFVQTDTVNTIQPSFSVGDYQLSPDNAFIGSDLRAALAGTDAADYPLISKFLNPGRTETLRRRTWRIVAGLNGDFDAGFAAVKWDAALNYGEMDGHFVNNSLEITENFAAAIDSVIDPRTGQAACRINVPTAPQTGQGAGALNRGACVPYNPFGQQNSAAALAYSFGAFATNDKLTQQVANLNASFDTSRFFNLQGGPVGVAVGGEYRMERTSDVNDPALVQGLTENLVNDSSGGYNVTEGYVEVNLPLFKDYAPFLKSLSVDAAYRGAHYSTVGGVGAYKFGFDYKPVDWFKLRGTYSRAIRAPNITEAFLPATPSFFNIVDPCSVENIGSNVNYAKNCAAGGLPEGFQANTNASIKGNTAGNPNLEPEKSISYTLGFVLTPPVVPGLSITLDYYSIKIKNAISNVQAQDILNNCYGSVAGLDPTFCSLFTRGSDKNINFVNTTFVNASKLFTDGYELQVAYRTSVSPLTSRWSWTAPLDGSLDLHLQANYVDHLRNFPFQSDPTNVHILDGVINNVLNSPGAEPSPHLRALFNATYAQGPATVSWQVRYLGRGARFNRDATSADGSEAFNVPFAEATFFHDISVRYKLDGKWGGRLDGTEVYAGINDLFDEQPPFFLIGTGRDIGYDLGRFMYAGVRFRR